jgi:glycosyltransferase involved in cell wall biosynthesis
VVNEAMACGRPAIVSDAAGCAADLVVAGRTGFTFALGVVDDLAARMLELRQALATDRASMTAAMAERMVRYSIPAAVRGTLDALSAVATPRPAELLPSR